MTLLTIFPLTFMIMCLVNNFNCNYCKSKSNNKNTHIIHGKFSINGSYKLLHINKGNSNFHNKINDIYSIIDIHKPDILSIQEANYDLKNLISIRGYNIEYKKLCSNDNKARTIMLVKDNINYKHMYEYEDDYISSI